MLRSWQMMSPISRGPTITEILAVSNHSLEREVVHRKRDLESEFHSDVALIHSAHSEVGEGVLGIVIEAHDLGLVLYGRIVTGDTDIIAGVAVRVVQVSGEGLDGLHVRNDGVTGPWRHESLVESRRSVIYATSA